MLVFGERLQYLRLEKDYTQEELGNKINMTEGMISSYERGVSLPNVAQFKDICDFFDVTPLYFLGYINVPMPIKNKDKYNVKIYFNPSLDESMFETLDECVDYLNYKKLNKK